MPCTTTKPDSSSFTVVPAPCRAFGCPLSVVEHYNTICTLSDLRLLCLSVPSVHSTVHKTFTQTVPLLVSTRMLPVSRSPPPPFFRPTRFYSSVSPLSPRCFTHPFPQDDEYFFLYEFEIPGQSTSADLSVAEAASSLAGAFMCGVAGHTVTPVTPSPTLYLPTQSLVDLGLTPQPVHTIPTPEATANPTPAIIVGTDVPIVSLTPMPVGIDTEAPYTVMPLAGDTPAPTAVPTPQTAATTDTTTKNPISLVGDTLAPLVGDTPVPVSVGVNATESPGLAATSGASGETCTLVDTCRPYGVVHVRLLGEGERCQAGWHARYIFRVSKKQLRPLIY